MPGPNGKRDQLSIRISALEQDLKRLRAGVDRLWVAVSGLIENDTTLLAHLNALSEFHPELEAVEGVIVEDTEDDGDA